MPGVPIAVAANAYEGTRITLASAFAGQCESTRRSTLDAAHEHAWFVAHCDRRKRR
jgi:hypothetical protein